MPSFAQAWPDPEVVQGPLAQITWWHDLALLEKVKDPEQRLWYARKTTLPAPQSDLARETLKDPYKLDFLGIAEDAEERVIEQGLVRHIRDFLLELGQGFAFVGNQVPLRVGQEEFRIDLLFYHLKLRCYVVIELKAGRFRPEHMGKLNFYLSAVDDLLRHPDDQPSIGLVLCKDREDIVAEYALRGTTQPMAVSQYELTKALPENLKNKLPSVEDLEAGLAEPEVGANDKES